MDVNPYALKKAWEISLRPGPSELNPLPYPTSNTPTGSKLRAGPNKYEVSSNAQQYSIVLEGVMLSYKYYTI